MYPRDALYRNNQNIDKIILFSYSGTTNDVMNSVKEIDKKNIYIVTKGKLQKIVLKTGIPSKHILSYRTSSNKGKERVFLSFEGAVSPAAIFLKYYFEKTNSSINLDNFISDKLQYWNKQIGKGDYTDAACYDLEIKIIESGIFNCIIHEKKNFLHGRFINYENLNNTFSIYFKQIQLLNIKRNY